MSPKEPKFQVPEEHLCHFIRLMHKALLLPVLLNYELSKPGGKQAYCAPNTQVKCVLAVLIEWHTAVSFSNYNSMARAGEGF